MSFFPKSTDFFDTFIDLSSLVAKAGSIVPELKNGKKKNINSFSKSVKRLELEATRIRHQITEKADSNFITPIDREDIHNLARGLDNIIDEVENLVSNMRVFEIKKDNKDFHELAETVTEATEKVHKLIILLKQRDKELNNMKRLIREIYTLENEGDDLNKTAVMHLFQTEKNAIDIIKWNEIFRTTETILNRCEDTADTVNEIIIKNF